MGHAGHIPDIWNCVRGNVAIVEMWRVNIKTNGEGNLKVLSISISFVFHTFDLFL